MKKKLLVLSLFTFVNSVYADQGQTVGDIINQRTTYLKSDGAVSKAELSIKQQEAQNKLLKLHLENLELQKKEREWKANQSKESVGNIEENNNSDFSFSNTIPLAPVKNKHVESSELKYTENLVNQTNTWIKKLKNKLFVSEISDMAGRKEATLWQNGKSTIVSNGDTFNGYKIISIDMNGVRIRKASNNTNPLIYLDLSNSQRAIDAYNQAQNIRSVLIEKQMAVLENAAMTGATGLGMTAPLSVEPMQNNTSVPGQMYR